jgi:formamidopyrimidine-DNA glycosylase
MPELPEVQTVVNILNSSVCINKKIISVEIYKKKILKNASSEEFRTFICNEKIITFSRKAKYIICHLSDRKILLIHLRMEGKLFCENKRDFSKQTIISEQEY